MLNFRLHFKPAKTLNCLHLITFDKYRGSSLTVEPCGVFEFSEQWRLSAP